MSGSVLYIEDEKFLGKTLRGMLEKAGFSVVLAGDGEAGFAEAQKGVHSVILLDILLPKIDGFEVLKRLKADPALAQTPVIVLSNLSSAEDKERAHALGARAYFVKALIDPKQLVVDIQKVISEKVA